MKSEPAATITPSASSEVIAVARPRRRPRRSNASTAGFSASVRKIATMIHVSTWREIQVT